MQKLLLTAAVCAFAVPALARAPEPNPNQAARSPVPAELTISGSRNGLKWTAANRIIGQTPTSDVASPAIGGGGDPLYFPRGNKSGTVALIMTYENGDRFICSGSLLSDRRSIATAAHCVSGGAGTPNPVSTTAYFYNGNPNERTALNPAVTAIDVTTYNVNPNYTGEVVDQNDIAVLNLASFAPSSARSYRLDNSSDLTGVGFNVAGYGRRSTVGGALGADAGTGFLREGDNIYDYALGDPAFGGFFTDVINGENFFGTAEIEFSFLSDFDNGNAANDMAGLIAQALGAGNAFDDVGIGAREVGIAGGDSGGPGFVNGRLASINSYGLSFGPDFGDFLPGLNSSWGEFSGYVPVFIHNDFIRASLVPEAGSWALMIGGLGLVGAIRRRRLAP